MRRISILLCFLCIGVGSIHAYSNISIETLYRGKRGTVSSSLGSNTYSGTELELLVSSYATVDELYSFSYFGGLTKAISVTHDQGEMHVSSYPASWFYGVGNTLLIPISETTTVELSFSYDVSYLAYQASESRVDHLRIALRLLQPTFEGLYVTFGLEYSKPLWGRVYTQDQAIQLQYAGSALALIAGFSYQLW